ncbi:MAG: putative Ig domain-containing protein [Verrucomicrobia bacterium]|nr:putative Ig domain-containing protein [Verrucomicrobiota bacterium]
MNSEAVIRHTKLVTKTAVLSFAAFFIMLCASAPQAGADGEVVAWGSNSMGQTNMPTGLSGVAAIAAGWGHNLALKNDGTVVAWGYDAFGQTNVPAGLLGVTAIAAGVNHNMALKGDGTVVAWGDNGYGQTNVPAGLSGVVAISGGYKHSMALKGDGTVVAWGTNDYGQISVPTGLSGVVAIGAGASHSIALKGDGTVIVWGSNYAGETNVPPGLAGVISIATGYSYNMALKSDGTVVAWGYSFYGQTNVPAGLSGVVAIAAGEYQAMALKADGTVVVWDHVWAGQTNVPTGLSGATTIASGNGHCVALKPYGPTITTNGRLLPGGGPGVAYSQTLAASGGSAPYNWTVVSGRLPAGLVLASNGIISGTPTARGLSCFRVRVSGADGLATEKEFALRINVAVNPASGSTLNSSTMTFSWDAVDGATQYALWVGTVPGGYDLYAKIEGTNRSRMLTVPTNGGNVYVRLWALISGTWQAVNDYSYTAAPPPVKAAMTSPANGSTNSSASVTFTWDAGVGASQYALWVGSASNTYDLHALLVGTNLSRTLSLPVDGRALYVRLWSCLYGNWEYNDYSYRAFNAVKARFTGLANGATLGGTNVTLNWDAGAGATQYALWVGSRAGTYDLAAMLTGTNLSQTLTLPADGRRLYVRLWSLINGTWRQNDYEFAAYTDPASLTAQMISPTNGTTLLSTPVTLNWSSGTGASQYALWVGSAPGDYDLHALLVGTSRTQALSVPLDGGSVYVRLWSLVGGTWQFNDYAYETSSGGAAVKAQMTSPANGGTLVAASTTFSWSAGTGVSQYALWMGNSPGSYELYAAVVGTNLTQAVTLPVDGGPVYVRLWSQMGGVWKFNDYFYTAFLAP